MLVETHCKDDLDIIQQQIGSDDVYISGIVERCSHGFPRIILLDPLKEDNGSQELNYQAISNLMWLTCPYLNDKIHEMETAGLIGSITNFIQNDLTLKSMMKNAHANFYYLRNVIYKKFSRFTGSAFEGNITGILKNGIGGIKNLDTLKAVSAVILRFPLMISLILVRGMNVSLESRYALIPIGIKNSSFRTSPG